MFSSTLTTGVVKNLIHFLPDFLLGEFSFSSRKLILIMFKLGKATARFAHWSHAGWGFNDWNRFSINEPITTG